MQLPNLKQYGMSEGKVFIALEKAACCIIKTRIKPHTTTLVKLPYVLRKQPSTTQTGIGQKEPKLG